ncbi:MAG TPA: hypothetical protein VMU54_22670 [Planctomycetota bacterium]|nr:hypothetical protein [Planctomycetota bacterium]
MSSRSRFRTAGAIFALTLVVLFGAERPLRAQDFQVTKVSPAEAGLHDRVEVTVDHWAPVQELARGKKLVLFLNGMEIPRIYPEAVLPTPSGGAVLRFYLDRTEDSKKAWSALLGRPVFTKVLPLSIGLEGASALPSTVTDFQLVVMRESRFVPWAIVMTLLLVLFLRLAQKSDLLRGSGPEELTTFLQELGVVLPAGARRPFSLGQSQMAFWFLIILGSFFFIWVVTTDLGTLSESVLVLMGIGSGTALGAAMIDSSKRSSGEKEARDLLSEKKLLAPDLAAKRPRLLLVPPPPNLEALRQEVSKMESRLVEIEHRLAELTPLLQGGTSEGFLKDILNDENGVSLHRFQMVAWTVVLGFVFLAGVYTDLGMPTFNAMLLAVMGISSGTYMGFKIPEKN